MKFTGRPTCGLTQAVWIFFQICREVGDDKRPPSWLRLFHRTRRRQARHPAGV